MDSVNAAAYHLLKRRAQRVNPPSPIRFNQPSLKFTDMKTQNWFALNILAGVLLLGITCATARAQLTPFYSVVGQDNWSISGVGSNLTPVGNLQANVPVGSTVIAAYMLSSTWTAGPTPNVTLGGTTYSGGDWTALPPDATETGLQAFSTNVTAQMVAAIGGGSASPFLFSVTENTNNSGTDGEMLAVVYSNPALTTHTIALFDGSLASAGATTTIHYASPLAGVGTPGFSEEMSIGDGFSYQINSAQYSIINVNGRRLTTSAGGADDAVDGGFPVGDPRNDASDTNGDLFTVGFGGINPASNPSDPNLVGGTSTDVPESAWGPGFSEFSPMDPADTTHYDKELYDLGQGNGVDASPFVSNGDTSTVIDTVNPSGDDNIFFLGLNITATATITTGVPDAAGTAGLMALALAALGLASMRKRLARAS